MKDLKPNSGFKGVVSGNYGAKTRFTRKIQESSRVKNYVKGGGV